MKRRIAMATLALIPFTATNAFASNQEGIVTATSLNVRSGPSTDSSFLFSIKKNDKVTILKSENGWYKISTANGHEGWASSEYISTNTSDTNQQSNKKVVNVDNLNMRNGASTSYRVIMKLNKGTVIEIISESNGWTKIKHDGRIGFVASKYLSPIENNNQTTKPEQQPNVPVQPQVSVGKTKVVVATSLNVRSGPSTGNSVIGSLKNNEKVEVISESNGWSKIKYNGKEGYVSSTYLKDSNEGGTSKPDETPKPNPNVETKIKVVAATSLNVRSGPSTSHGIIGSLKNNEKVEVISESNGWSKIKPNGKEGYVSSTYLKDSNEGGNSKPNETPKPNPNVETKTKVVVATSLNVRSGPSTGHGIIGSLKNNEKVEVISESNGWSKIKYNGKEGYVSSTYLKDSNEGGTSKPDEKPNIGTKIKVVSATSLNVRSGPSTGHGIIGSLKNNEKVEVISESNGWSKIKYNGKEGYVSSTYLTDYQGGGTNPGGGSGGSSSEVVNGATVNYRNLSYSLQDHVNKQASKGNGNMISGRGFVQASRSDIEHYINPKNFTSSKSGMLQFLRLDSYKGGISASELNGYLNSLSPASSGTNVFYNQGQAFLDAARKYNIDVVYLVGHSMVETGYGKSTLAQGQVLTSYKGSPLPKPVKVYNFFGIGAFDGTANLSGAEAAYKNGWTTVEKTIEGSAKWLSQNYIHNGGYDQNTLYKMRWSYEHLWHQYATDVNWANVISSVMSRLVGMYDTNSNLVYEVPVHR
ncbi:beta- N-acetylglucosaminidase [Paraclostridium sordellii]|uniref:beta- N-acetylglucosaminidase n=1 Tax=Paraclostridium sordellii TaxID=1505 RepID=UPI00038590D9|nr:beta- N-acetylglucosaminidase [Paeniclostridium sordellii]EPZ58182.1 mannosyl-glycoendo-beta-N-acetylglucosamidase domain protein, possible enterotoxin [[Clostridium] sordellii VPI 9048] [Paeniclostridium sordellii VPI 9048]